MNDVIVSDFEMEKSFHKNTTRGRKKPYFYEQHQHILTINKKNAYRIQED